MVQVVDRREHHFHEQPESQAVLTTPSLSSETSGSEGFLGMGLFRSRRSRVIGGVCGGVGERLGIDPVLVRIAFAMLSLGGFVGLILYAVLWAVMPEDEGAGRILEPGVRRAGAMALVVAGSMLLLREVDLWFGDGVVSSAGLAALGAAVIRMGGTEASSARWSGLAERFPAGASRTIVEGRLAKLRLLAGSLLLAGSVATFLARTEVVAAAPTIFLAVTVTIAGLGLIFGPWAWRLARQVAEERRERIRSQERADMAAHLHDSVLQTLALIQRTDQPKEMVALARSQERELRSWLNGGPPRTSKTIAGAVEEAASAVELQFKVPVEVVTVGDAPLDERLQAVVEACREAVLNAAKHSGASRISVYVEVEPDTVNAFVKDEGDGFDLAAVANDRRGIAESIRGRMERSGGSASIVTQAGVGTEVQLTMSRAR